MDCNMVEKANQMVNRADAVYFGVLDEQGFPSVSTVSRVQSDGIFTLYFATGISGNKAKRLLQNGKASVCVQDQHDNVSLVGEAEVLTDEQSKQELWQDWFLDHFPGGKDDPEYCIIKFTAARASLWIGFEEAAFWVKDVLQVQSRCGLLCHSCSFKGPCHCGGCIETMGNPFHGECPVAQCCQQNGMEHCGECPKLPCALLEQYSCGDPEHGDKPAGARIRMVEQWAKHHK